MRGVSYESGRRARARVRVGVGARRPGQIQPGITTTGTGVMSELQTVALGSQLQVTRLAMPEQLCRTHNITSWMRE